VTLPSAPPAIRLVVTRAPRTKKNSNRMAKVTRTMKGKLWRRVLPSKAWETWAATAEVRFLGADPRGVLALGRSWINWPVNCEATFYRDAKRGDAVGYYQGLADLLQKRRVIANDVLIESWDGSRLLKDAKNPRVEIVLRPVEG